MHCLGKHFERSDLEELFGELDADGSGTLTIKELRIFCSRMHFNIPNKQLVQARGTPSRPRARTRGVEYADRGTF